MGDLVVNWVLARAAANGGLCRKLCAAVNAGLSRKLGAGVCCGECGA